jgi:tRNA-(ms[2]io[6]A)-hydroxylase
MLHLRHRTAVDWAPRVLEGLPELLVEQAHLEKKAASAALGFLFRYPEHLVLQAPLSELAREELEHFERTLALLEGRGIPFGRQQPGPYAARLLRVVRPADPERLLDHMLCCAVIEARSCERMKVLSDALRGRDDQLADFYHDLVVSEARHHGLYVRLAKELFDPTEVQARLDEILDHEGGVMREATGMARLHD